MASGKWLIAAVLALAGAAQAEMVVEWWGSDARCRHKGMTIELSKYGKEGMISDKAGKKDVEGIHALKFDLSPIPKGVKVYRASLRIQAPLEKIRTDRRVYMDIGGGVWYFDPLRLYAEMKQWKDVQVFAAASGTEGDKAVWDKDKPLAIEPPLYRSLDATAAVQDWVSGKTPNLGFVVRQLDMWDWQYERTVLEVCYEGQVKGPPAQVKDVKVAHRKGQSFITWTEVEQVIEQDPIEWAAFEPLFKKVGPRGRTFYRVYRHSQPITAANIAQAARVGEIWPLSGYDIRMHQHVTQGEEWMGLDPKSVVNRYVIESPPSGKLEPNSMGPRGRREWWGKQLPMHTGLYVHQSPQAGKAYYAVTALVDGVENTHDLAAGVNCTGEAVDEAVGPGEPTLYRVLDQSMGEGRNITPVETQFFMYWAAPPMSNLPRHAVHVLITLNAAGGRDKSKFAFTGDDMYGSCLVSGPNLHGWRDSDMIFTIVDDAAFASASYMSNWNTMLSGDQGKREPYAQRVADQFLPWSKALPLRLFAPPAPASATAPAK